MIKLTKKIEYYNGGKFSHVDTIKKESVTTLEDALEMLKLEQLHYVENKTGISSYELIEVLQTAGDTFYKYTKTIDRDTKQEKTFAPDEKKPDYKQDTEGIDVL